MSIKLTFTFESLTQLNMNRPILHNIIQLNYEDKNYLNIAIKMSCD